MLIADLVNVLSCGHGYRRLVSAQHGYSLGQYRLPTHKMQVYENTLRVPFFIRGPGNLSSTHCCRIVYSLAEKRYIVQTRLVV